MSTSETGDTRVRLLRILEYTFRDQEAMDTHLGMMTVPLQGTYSPAGTDPHVKIRSTAFYPSGEEHGSLFTAEAPEPKVEGTVLVLGATQQEAMQGARSLAARAGRFEYQIWCPDGGTSPAKEHAAAVALPGVESQDGYLGVRLECYEAGLAIYTPNEFVTRQRGGL